MKCIISSPYAQKLVTVLDAYGFVHGSKKNLRQLLKMYTQEDDGKAWIAVIDGETYTMCTGKCSNCWGRPRSCDGNEHLPHYALDEWVFHLRVKKLQRILQ